MRITRFNCATFTIFKLVATLIKVHTVIHCSQLKNQVTSNQSNVVSFVRCLMIVSLSYRYLIMCIQVFNYA